MKSLILISLAFLLSVGPHESHSIPLEIEAVELETIETIESPNSEKKVIEKSKPNEELDYYQQYLEELAQKGPKQMNLGDENVQDSESQVDTVTDTAPAEEPKNADNQASTDSKPISKQEPKSENSLNHASFGQILSTYVDSKGQVDYAGLKKKEASLDTYLKELEAYDVAKSSSKNEKLAFWINAYNAFTLKLILENYPLKSITDLDNGKPWDRKWIALNGKTLSLNNIENDIIRKEFSEPRIHFAVNCAAASCPPLLNDAFYPDKLNAQLESQAKKFINNTTYNSISASQMELSKIFDWYGADFGNLNTYIGEYVDTDVSKASIAFKEYNWALNGK